MALWLPAALAQVMGTVFRRAPMMTLGKLRELYHADWVCQAESGALASAALPGWPSTTASQPRSPGTDSEDGCDGARHAAPSRYHPVRAFVRRRGRVTGRDGHDT